MHSLQISVLSILCGVIFAATWNCGTKFDGLKGDSSALSKSFVTSNCGNKTAAINRCCGTLDTCYDNQNGKKKCDTHFCNCIGKAAKTNTCTTAVEAMCLAVLTLGDKAYENAGKKHG